MNLLRRKSFVLLIAILAICFSKPITTDLPPLESFNVTYPTQQQTVKSKQHFKLVFDRGEDVQVVITGDNGQNAAKACSYIPEKVVTTTLHDFQFTSSSELGDAVASMVVVPAHNLVYVANKNMVLTAFSYSSTNTSQLTRLVSVPISHTDDRDSAVQNEDGIFLVSTLDNENVLLFSRFGVWRISTKKILSKIDKIEVEFKHPVSDAVAIGSFVFVASASGGVFLFELDIYNTPKLVAHYESFNKNKIYPTSISVDKTRGLLFVLDQVANIYVFKHDQEKLIAYDIIDVQHFGNFHVRSYKNELFYSFVQGGSFKIAELYYDSEHKKAELVRYYKLFDYIFDFLLSDDNLIVFSTETMDVFPINIDPRMIKEEHNGVRTPAQAKRGIKLLADRFLLCDGNKLELVNIEKTPPTVQCYFTNEHEQITVEYRANSSSCHTEKKKYNSYCAVSQTMKLHIDIPEKGERQKIILYGVVVLFVVLFLLGVMCLIQWRNSRLDWIDFITDQIKNYQGKQGNARAFVDEGNPTEPAQENKSEGVGSEAISDQ